MSRVQKEVKTQKNNKFKLETKFKLKRPHKKEYETMSECREKHKNLKKKKHKPTVLKIPKPGMFKIKNPLVVNTAKTPRIRPEIPQLKIKEEDWKLIQSQNSIELQTKKKLKVAPQKNHIFEDDDNDDERKSEKNSIFQSQNTSSSLKCWERKWVKIENTRELGEDIWVLKWVRSNFFSLTNPKKKTNHLKKGQKRKSK